MEQIVRSLKVAWRSERLLRENELRLLVQKVQLNALAGMVVFVAFVMLNFAGFYLLDSQVGKPLAAFCIAGIDVVLAALLMLWSASLKPAPEVALVEEVRDMALADVEEELAVAETELIALKDEIQDFVKNPMGTLLPVTIGPLLGAVTRAIASSDK